MDRFTFAVLTYNQESIVLETLESIKYQVVRYGVGYNNRIIIVDDCSDDATVQVVDKWLDSNKQYFGDVVFIKNSINRGTSYGFNLILDRIVDEGFKVIAGDDLIADINIYEQFDSIENGHLNQYVRCYLKQGKVVIDLESLYRHFWVQAHSAKIDYFHEFIRGGLIHTPSTLYSKRLYDDSKAKRLNSKFVLFEDDPTWYSMIKGVQGFQIDNKNSILTLYRISDKSVSTSSSALNDRFQKELKMLNCLFYKKAGLWDRLYIKSKYSRLPKVFRIKTFSDFKRKLKYRMYSWFHKSEFDQFVECVKKQAHKQVDYYKFIIKCVNDQRGV